MKASLVTLHYVRNFGSLLQTYATQKVLRNMGVDVTTVNFIPQGLTVRTGVKNIRKTGNPVRNFVRKTGALLSFSERQLVMRNFLRKNIALSPVVYHNYSELAKAPPEADIYISGSDQIWNTQNDNLVDDIKAYYLDFVPDGVKRIAYASSIGKDGYSDEEKPQVRKWLNKYNSISVRESSAVDILRGLEIDSVHVLDPTLLLNEKQWMEFVGDAVYKPVRHYILAYNLNKNKKIEECAGILSKEKNLPVIRFSDIMKITGGINHTVFARPENFLQLVKNADYVVTDSFHGTAFSINFSRQFMTFAAPRFNSRIESILGVFGLESRFTDDARKAADTFSDKIDYTKVTATLAVEREKSMNYLRGVLYGSFS